MLRTVIYSRKSLEDDDKQVQSIESQENELRPIAVKRNLTVLKELGEAQSAKAPGRPKFNQMMDMVNRGEVDVILAWKLDRLARNPIDGAAILWAMKTRGLVVMTPQQSFSQAEDNQILMYIEFGMAQKYIDDLGRNTKRGLKMKAEKGWFPGIAPTGYLNSKVEERGHKTVLIDPERFSAVRRMWDLMLAGNHSVTKIIQIANNEWGFRTRRSKRNGGKPLCRSSIYKIFSDPFYYGRYEYPRGSGNWHEGKHKPMVTQAEFEAVRKRLSDSSPVRQFEEADFFFTGLIKCGECGSAITAHSKIQVRCSGCRHKSSIKNQPQCSGCGLALAKMKQAQVRRYTYYHCTRHLKPSCRQKSITSADLETQVRKKILQFHLPDELKLWGLEFIQSLYHQEIVEREQILREKRTLLAKCAARLENLLNLKTSPENVKGSLISDEEYQKQRAELLAQKSSLSVADEHFDETLQKKVRVIRNMLEFVAALGPSEIAHAARAGAVLRTLGSNHILTNKNLVIKPDFPFSELPPAKETDTRNFPPIEPDRTEHSQSDLSESDHHCPFPEPRPDKDRTKRLGNGLRKAWRGIEDHWERFELYPFVDQSEDKN